MLGDGNENHSGNGLKNTAGHEKTFFETACGRILDKRLPLSRTGSGEITNIFESRAYMEQEDKKLSEMFDDTKRSTAVFKIAAMIGHHLLDENGLTKFSEESRSRVETINERRCAAGARIDPAIDPFRRIW